MVKRISIKRIVVWAASCFIGFKMVIVGTPIIFQYNEILGIFSIVVIMAGSIYCTEKFYMALEHLIRTSKTEA